MTTYDVVVNYASSEEVMLEVEDIPILIRADEDGISLIIIGEEEIEVNE